MSTALRPRTLAGIALAAGLLLLAPGAAHAQLIAPFGPPYRPFNGRMDFSAGANGPTVRSVHVKPLIDKGWATARPRVEKLLKDELAKRRFRGQSAYQINVALAANGKLEALADGPRLAVKYILRGNSVTAKMTTPTVFGSYADPKFSIDFDVEMVFHIGRLPNGKLGVTSASASLHNAKLRGRNVTGTVGLAIADAVGIVGGPNLRQMAQNAINTQSISKTLNVALAPVALPGTVFASMSTRGGVNVRLIQPGPGPVIR